jgi:hypothetical protein
MFTISQLKIITYNVNSIYSISKRISLNLFVRKFKPDILLLQETNLTTRNVISQNGYEVFQTPKNSVGRGTAIFINNAISGQQITISGLMSSEATAIVIKVNNNESFLFLSLYFFSGSSKASIKTDLTTIHQLCSQHTYCLIGGDWNARHPLWQDDISSIQGEAIVEWLTDHCHEHSLVVISQPLKTFPKTPSTLDFFMGSSNILCILPELQNYSCAAYPSDSDHFAVELLIRLNQCLLTERSANDRELNYSKIDWNTFQMSVSNEIIMPPINRNLSNSEIDEAILNFESAVNQAIDHQKSPISNKDRFSRLPANIQAIQAHRQRIRKKLQRIFHRTLNRTSNEYKLLQAELHCTDILYKNAVKRYQNDELTKKLKDIKPGPDTFRKIGFIVGKKNRLPDILTAGNNEVSQNDTKAEAFADFFETNFVDSPPQHLPEFMLEVENKIAEIDEHSTSLQTFSEENVAVSPCVAQPFTNPDEIREIIERTNTKKSSGKDNISNKILHKLPRICIVFLTVIFNNCLNNCYFPLAWKEAKIIPIPKKTDRRFISNYRPISLICCVSKILESLLLKQINSHCDNHNIIPVNQYGFRKKCSTIHPLLKLHNHITTGLNKKECTVACLLDIQKAFDTVWIKGLIFKMFSMEFPLPLLKLCWNFLKNRSFYVQIVNDTSSKRKINAGVPQGSRLGPVLFNIYTADQPANELTTNTMLFADDSITYSTSMSPEIATSRVEQHIHRLWNYYLKWGLRINSSKSELICFRIPTSKTGRKGFAGRCQQLKLTFPDGNAISATNSVKYLGIHFAERFLFNPHAIHSLSKANFALRLVNPLLRRSNGLSKNTKLLIYKQLIRPVITFGFPVWFTVSPSIMEKICVFERKILRLCTGLRRDPITKKFQPNSKLYEEANVTPVKFFMLNLAKKTLHNLEHHHDESLKIIINQEISSHLRYLHSTILISTNFEEEEEEAFYCKRNPNHFRG